MTFRGFSRIPALLALIAVGMASVAEADRSAPGRTRRPDPDRSIPVPGTAIPEQDAAPAAPAPPPAPGTAVTAAPVVTAAPGVTTPPVFRGATPAPAPPPTMTMTPSAPVAAPVPAGPPGKVEIPTLEHDAGTVERGADITHAFVLKNVGQHPLTVDAKPACGCTVTEYDKIIAPGGTGKIHAVVKTASFKGPTSKGITITTNDPENARFTLTVKANVVVPMDVQPSENLAFNGKAGALDPQQLTVKATGGEAFDVLSVDMPDAGRFSVKVEPQQAAGPARAGTLASGDSAYRVTVTPTADVPVGRLNSTITLKTNHPKSADIALRVFGTVTGEIEVAPQYVTLSTGAAALPEAKVQHVAIRKPTGDPLVIASVASDNPDVVATIKAVAEGREYALEVRYIGEPLATALASKVKLVTNDPRQPQLDVQIWGRVDPGMRLPQQASQAPARPPVTAITPVQAQVPASP